MTVQAKTALPMPLHIEANMLGKLPDSITPGTAVERLALGREFLRRMEATYKESVSATKAKLEPFEKERKHMKVAVEKANAFCEQRLNEALAKGELHGSFETETGVKLSTLTSYALEVEDAGQIPDEYMVLQPNMAKITEAMKEGITVPGIKRVEIHSFRTYLPTVIEE